MANKNTRRKRVAVRRASKAGTYDGPDRVRFGKNIDSSAERARSGRDKYCAPTIVKGAR